MTDPSALVAASLLWFVVFVAFYIWTALALGAVFRKSGDQSWKAWVPILNSVTLFQLGGFSGWLVLLYIVPVAGWVVQIMACHRIGTAFGFGAGMTVLSAFLLPVWATVIGFGSARWVGRDSAPGPRRSDAPAPATVQPPPTDTPAPAPASAFAPEHTYAPTTDADEVTGAVTGAPAPISAVPFVRTAEPAPDPFAAPAPAAPAPAAPAPAATRMPDPADEDTSQPAGRILRRSTAVPDDDLDDDGPPPWAPVPESEGFAETSGPVSAVAGAPQAGGPRSALSSVSAQTRSAQIPDDPIEETIIARRRRPDWSLVPPSGDPIPLSSDVVLVGRRPAADPRHPGAQLVSIDDGTVSKTHARLELRGDVWYVTDLDSTNGIVFATVLGTEVEATPGVETEAGDRFLLGDAEIRLTRSGR